MNDDMGYSDIGCYGGETDTPVLNRLAANGIRFTQFYNTARCCPTRASMLTGLHPHQTGIGLMTRDDSPEGYAGSLNNQCVTISEALKLGGYRTYMSGKWHVSSNIDQVNDTWPQQRGFDRFYGIISGAANFFHPDTLKRDNDSIDHEALHDGNYYFTDAVSEQAVQFIEEHARDYPDAPFFQYVAYTAPHWPLHAREEDIAKYTGRFDTGWDKLREARLNRMVEMGIVDARWQLTERDSTQPAWEDADHKEWHLRRMEVYAAQLDRMDQGIGSIVSALERSGRLDNTLILFLSDNGGCAEELVSGRSGQGTGMLFNNRFAREHTKKGTPVAFGNRADLMPGGEDTYQSYGAAWANLSNTPFRLYKHWVHEGGIATPLIACWPDKITDRGALRHTPGQLPDIMATVLDAAGIQYPDTFHGVPILPLEGTSLLPVLEKDELDRRLPLCWEHEGNGAIRIGDWKLVRKYPEPWELYNVADDRTEVHDLSGEHPEKAAELLQAYEEWTKRCGVIDREVIMRIPRKPK
jgi:arylsulfatase